MTVPAEYPYVPNESGTKHFCKFNYTEHDTLAEAKEAAVDGLELGHSMSYVVITKYKDKYLCSVMNRQPCWGALRKYPDDTQHPDTCTQPYDDTEERPRDLPILFPPGKPVWLRTAGRPWYNPAREVIQEAAKDPTHIANTLMQFLLSGESPWRSGIVPGATHYEFEEKSGAFVITFEDTQFDPTVMVHLHLTLMYKFFKTTMLDYVRASGYNLKVAAFLLYANINMSHYYSEWDMDLSDYPAEAQRFFDGDTIQYGGGTFGDGYDYCRCDVENVFWDQDNEPFEFEESVFKKYEPKVEYLKDVLTEAASFLTRNFKAA